MKDKKLLFSIFLVFVFLLSVGLTYAYFSLDVFGNEDANLVITSTSKLELTYNGGPTILASDIFPGWTSTKSFTVTNTGSLDAYYSIDWENINNEIIRDELKMNLTCTGIDCKTLSEKTVGNVDGPFVESIKITPGVTHTYELTLMFIETSSEQNYNQEKGFSGTIVIRESSEGAVSLFNMYGTIVDASNAPIAGATMTLMSEPKTAVTDENGNFVFEDVEADNHTITASVEGEEILSDSLTIINGETTEIEDTTITRRERTNQINVKIKVNADKSIATIDPVHNTLSPDWATILEITKENIIAIPIETTIESPATYTFNGTTYNKSQNGVDVSENNDGSVLASTYTDGIDEVIVMINSRGMTSLPEDSTAIFSDSISESYFINTEYIKTENLDTSRVANMENLFYLFGESATSLSMDVTNWDTSQVLNMFNTFCNVGYDATTWSIGDLSNWNTSKVTDMESVFSEAGYNATTWNIGDLKDWNTSQVINMLEMFYGVGHNSESVELNLSNWDTSQVMDMSSMFEHMGTESETIELNLSNWNISQVQKIGSMFANTGTNSTTSTINIRGFNLSSFNTTLIHHYFMFGEISSNVQIIVGSSASKEWILEETLSSNVIPLTDSNIIVDETIPTNNRVSIESGTINKRVLTLSSTNANTMCISNTSSDPANCTNWEGYKTTKLWKFPRTIGTHTVYVFYRFGSGTSSTAVSASTTVTSITPILVNETFDDTIYDSNITVSPGEPYPWIISNGRFKGTHHDQVYDISSSTISFTPTQASILTFDYGVSCNEYSDGLTITLTGSDSSSQYIVDSINREVTGTVEKQLIEGVTYTLELFFWNSMHYSDEDTGAYIDNLLIE